MEVLCLDTRRKKIAIWFGIIAALCVGFVAGRYKPYENTLQPTTPMNTGLLLSQAISVDEIYSFQSLWSPYRQTHATQALLDELHKHMSQGGTGFVTQEVITDAEGHEIIVRLDSPDLMPQHQVLIDDIKIVK